MSGSNFVESADPGDPVGSVDSELVLAIRELIPEIHTRNQQGKCLIRQGKLFIIIGGSMVIASVIALCILIPLSLSNRKILNVVEDVTNPAGHRAQSQQLSTVKLLKDQAEELDCRNRRLTAGMPAPEFGPDPLHPVTCRSQTPFEIFPGKF